MRLLLIMTMITLLAMPVSAQAAEPYTLTNINDFMNALVITINESWLLFAVSGGVLAALLLSRRIISYLMTMFGRGM